MKTFDLVVIGGGPAGIAAAATASKHGLQVAIIDERPTLGGQIYKRVGPGFKVKSAKEVGKDYLRERSDIPVEDRSISSSSDNGGYDKLALSTYADDDIGAFKRGGKVKSATK